jgi:hypothetical protein
MIIYPRITVDADMLLLSDNHDVPAALKLKKMNKDLDDVLEELMVGKLYLDFMCGMLNHNIRADICVRLRDCSAG